METAQRQFQFEPVKESQAERLRRILSGALAQYVAPAAQLTFTPTAARRAASIAQSEPRRHTAG